MKSGHYFRNSAGTSRFARKLASLVISPSKDAVLSPAEMDLAPPRLPPAFASIPASKPESPFRACRQRFLDLAFYWQMTWSWRPTWRLGSCPPLFPLAASLGILEYLAIDPFFKFRILLLSMREFYILSSSAQNI